MVQRGRFQIPIESGGNRGIRATLRERNIQRAVDMDTQFDRFEPPPIDCKGIRQTVISPSPRKAPDTATQGSSSLQSYCADQSMNAIFMQELSGCYVTAFPEESFGSFKADVQCKGRSKNVIFVSCIKQSQHSSRWVRYRQCFSVLKSCM